MTIEELRNLQPSYYPDPEIVSGLTGKTLVMIVGPAAVGKSAIMKEIVRQADDFGRVSGFTTRTKRADDEPDLYRYISIDEAVDLIKKKAVIQYAVHPTTEAIYGTVPEDYSSRFNVLDTLSSVVEPLRTLPFDSTVTISVTVSPHTWREWFTSRYPEQSEERTKRLKEAKQSIEWSLAQNENHHWILNEEDRLEDIAKQAIAIVRGDELSSEGLQENAGNMLSVIDELLFMDKKL